MKIKLFIIIYCLTYPLSLYAQLSFEDRCEFYKSDNISDEETFKKQFIWLQKRFKSTNCAYLRAQIQKMKSLNQLIPTFNFNETFLTDDNSPLKPFELSNTDLRDIVESEEDWELYRHIFKDLRIFSEFDNIYHMNHDPLKDEEENLCHALNAIPSINSVTIRYTYPEPNIWHLNENETACIIDKNIRIYVSGNFYPDHISNKIKKNISGIENFRGDIRILNQYPKLQHLGLLNYQGESSLKVLIGIKALNHLNVNVASIKEPEEIGHLSYLNYLSLNCLKNDQYRKIKCSKNAIKHLGFIRNLKSLKGLDISWNDIEDISVLADLKNIEYLILGMNQIKRIEALKSLPKLRYLDLSNNKINEIIDIQSRNSLKFLNISGNEILDYSSLSRLKKIKYLSAGGNPYIAGSMELPQSLVVLNLSNDTSKSSEIDFHLSHTFFTPHEEVDEFNWTKHTLFNHNREQVHQKYYEQENLDTILAKKFNNLKNIQFLSLRRNGLGFIPTLKKMTKLKFLDLSSNSVRDLTPLLLLNKDVLEYINLYANNISETYQINTFRKLKYLNLSNNYLSNNLGILRIPSLKILVLRNCDLINKIDLSSVPNIEFLILDSNNLNSLNVQRLSNLKLLNISFNNLEEVPDFETNLKLREINLSNNKISRIHNITKVALEFRIVNSYHYGARFDLSNNAINDLSIFKYEILKNISINVHDNPVNRMTSDLCPQTSPNSFIREYCG